MANKIVLISDDFDFFDYIKNKLELRKSDELYSFNFDQIPSKVHLIKSGVIIINGENSNDKTLELLNILKDTPTIVLTYNEDDVFKRKCYRAGAIDYMSLLIPDAEFRARLLPALKISGILEKNNQYRDILVKHSIINKTNEVYLNSDNIIEDTLKKIKDIKMKAVFMAISPSDKTKLKLSQNNIETILINNIRKNDILINYAPNKYFLILFNIDINQAEKLWNKISSQSSYQVFAGFTNITNQSKQQLISETLNKLHQSINYNNIEAKVDINDKNNNLSLIPNFKQFKQNFEQKIEQTIIPVFYNVQQKYADKFTGLTIQQGTNNGTTFFCLKNNSITYLFKITYPGFSKINITITLQNNTKLIDSKRITLEPEELESGLLQDLLEQFILELKKEVIL